MDLVQVDAGFKPNFDQVRQSQGIVLGADPVAYSTVAGFSMSLPGIEQPAADWEQNIWWIEVRKHSESGSNTGLLFEFKSGMIE